MWLFLATEIMFFAGVLGTYIVLRRGNPGLFEGHQAGLLWQAAAVNTVILITSSLTMALAVVAVPKGETMKVAGFLLTEGVIDGPDDLTAHAHVDSPADPQGNTVDVVLAAGVPAARRDRATRELFASSSCGIVKRQPRASPMVMAWPPAHRTAA